MIKSIAVVGFALAIATSAQAMPQAPIAQSDAGIMMQVAYGCGAGRTRINGICIGQNNRPPNTSVLAMVWRNLPQLAIFLSNEHFARRRTGPPNWRRRLLRIWEPRSKFTSAGVKTRCRLCCPRGQ